MKKIYTAAMLLFVFILTPMVQVQVFAEEPVPYAQTSSTPAYSLDLSGKMKAFIAGVSKQIKNLQAELSGSNKKLETATRENAIAITDLTKSNEKLGNKVDKLAEATKWNEIAIHNASRKIDGVGLSVKKEAGELGEQNFNNAWLTNSIIVSIGIILFGMLAWVIWYLTQRVGRSTNAITNAIEASRVSVINQVTSEIQTSENNIVDRVKAFDSSPFSLKAAGHTASYDAATEEGCYLTFYVEDDHGSIDPALFDRRAEDNRGKAIHLCNGALAKYILDEKFRETPTGKLMTHLKDSGCLRIVEKN